MIKKSYNFIKKNVLWLFIGGTVLAASIGINPSIEEEIGLLENTYFAKHGKYLQVLPNNKLPDYENGTVQSKLGKTIPDNCSVDVYENPQEGKFILFPKMGYKVKCVSILTATTT